MKRTAGGLRKQKGNAILKLPKGSSRSSEDLSHFPKAKVRRKNQRCVFHTGVFV